MPISYCIAIYSDLLNFFLCQLETSKISRALSCICRQGYFTINSQPAVNGEKSEHKVFGWGGPGGRVYQKAYIEFFCSPDMLEVLKSRCSERHSNLTLHAINVNGEEAIVATAGSRKTVTAVTWGVFPDMEILQPTVFDRSTFAVWSKEAFQLWIDVWAAIYDDESPSAELIYTIYETYYLVAVVDNDYVSSNIFSLFGLVDEAESSR